MSKLKVENFGPITTGFTEDDGFMDFRKVTVFIGNQGTGKSSVAKLFSTCSWLEKALFQGRVTEQDVTSHNRFVKKYCAYQNLKSYFRQESAIEYHGQAYILIYRDEKLAIQRVIETTDYRVPQIMYVPAERNFLSVVDEPDKLKGLPQPLTTFWEELRQAQLEAPENLPLVVDGVNFSYDKAKSTPRISGKTAGGVVFDLRLSEASSGFQSLVPLLLVLRYLAMQHERDNSRSVLSPEERRKLDARVLDVMNNTRLTEEARTLALNALGTRFRTETLLSVVEEPEQNLFPTSQRAMLYQLLAYVHKTDGNELAITTHSPYIINYLTLAIKAYDVKSKIAGSAQHEKLRSKLAEIVPDKAEIAPEDVVVYELTDTGVINRLPMENGLPSDENDLNEALGAANARFSDLLRIEQYAQRG